MLPLVLLSLTPNYSIISCGKGVDSQR